jgi:hypothetical protein
LCPAANEYRFLWYGANGELRAWWLGALQWHMASGCRACLRLQEWGARMAAWTAPVEYPPTEGDDDERTHSATH